MKGQLHYIEADIAGNLGLAWAVIDWKLFGLWLEIWATKHETT